MDVLNAFGAQQGTPDMGEDTSTSNGDNRAGGWLKSNLTNLVVLGTFLFSIGSWWTRTEALEKRVDAAEKREAAYVRQDVALEQYRALSQRLEDVIEQLRQIRDGAPSPPRRH